MHVHSDLWLDQPDAHDQIETRRCLPAPSERDSSPQD